MHDESRPPLPPSTPPPPFPAQAAAAELSILLCGDEHIAGLNARHVFICPSFRCCLPPPLPFPLLSIRHSTLDSNHTRAFPLISIPYRALPLAHFHLCALDPHSLLPRWRGSDAPTDVLSFPQVWGGGGRISSSLTHHAYSLTHHLTPHTPDAYSSRSCISLRTPPPPFRPQEGALGEGHRLLLGDVVLSVSFVGVHSSLGVDHTACRWAKHCPAVVRPKNGHVGLLTNHYY